MLFRSSATHEGETHEGATHEGETRLVNTDQFVQIAPGPDGIELVLIIKGVESCLKVTESLSDLALLLGAVELGECTTCEGTGRFSVARYKRRLDEKYPRLISSPLPDDGSPCGRCSGTGKVVVPYRERGE